MVVMDELAVNKTCRAYRCVVIWNGRWMFHMHEAGVERSGRFAGAHAEDQHSHHLHQSRTCELEPAITSMVSTAALGWCCPRWWVVLK